MNLYLKYLSGIGFGFYLICSGGPSIEMKCMGQVTAGQGNVVRLHSIFTIYNIIFHSYIQRQNKGDTAATCKHRNTRYEINNSALCNACNCSLTGPLKEALLTRRI